MKISERPELTELTSGEYIPVIKDGADYKIAASVLVGNAGTEPQPEPQPEPQAVPQAAAQVVALSADTQFVEFTGLTARSYRLFCNFGLTSTAFLSVYIDSDSVNANYLRQFRTYFGSNSTGAMNNFAYLGYAYAGRSGLSDIKICKTPNGRVIAQSKSTFDDGATRFDIVHASWLHEASPLTSIKLVPVSGLITANSVFTLAPIM